MEKIKAVIFDLDGTVANTIPLCLEAFKKSIEPLIGRFLSDEEIIETFGPSEEGTIKALIPDYFEKGVSDYLYNYQELHEKCPSPFDGIIDLLNHLKKRQIRIAMVTGKGEHSTKITLEKFNIGHFFEVIETGHLDGGRKPEGIQTVLTFFHEISKNEVIYVGDAPSDIVASRKVGVPIIAAAWAESAEPERLSELEPDELFYTIHDFANWIKSNI